MKQNLKARKSLLSKGKKMGKRKSGSTKFVKYM